MATGLVAPAEGSEASVAVCCAPFDERTDALLGALATYAPLRLDLDCVSQADVPASERDKVAVVGLDDATLLQPGLRAIEELRKAHFDVIAWAPGSDRWPVALRARAFIAGADALLDGVPSQAAELLREHVGRCLRNQAASRDERAILLTQMRDLGIIGDSTRMLTLFGNILRVSRLSDVPVLIHGETGTGKELVAHAIHALDAKRCSNPFLPVNCAALNSGIAESELFGHRRGAFTGADRDRRGLIRSADGGVLFLDEVGELDLGLQAKLLRVLQEGRVLAVGEDRETEFDIRIIAATNRSLPDMVAAGTFRADLYHRLSVVGLRLPPLRERRRDLPALVTHFVRKHHGLATSPAIEVSSEFLEALASLELPGNARQLENLVRCALLGKSDSRPLGLCDLPREVWLELAGRAATELEAPLPAPEPRDIGALAAELLDICHRQRWELPHLLEEVERLVLKAALAAQHGDLSKAGFGLGLKARTLYNKRQKYQLDA
jgi:transcriptional regulator with GAF, ATPase, and Fis domain